MLHRIMKISIAIDFLNCETHCLSSITVRFLHSIYALWVYFSATAKMPVVKNRQGHLALSLFSTGKAPLATGFGVKSFGKVLTPQWDLIQCRIWNLIWDLILWPVKLVACGFVLYQWQTATAQLRFGGKSLEKFCPHHNYSLRSGHHVTLGFNASCLKSWNFQLDQNTQKPCSFSMVKVEDESLFDNQTNSKKFCTICTQMNTKMEELAGNTLKLSAFEVFW